ncbi:MAG: arginine repressor [Ruminococcus sp.]|jgi:transcriptional regulator of arginine metabolism|nr:arginine repressor [Ruminococcus sp.]
MKTRRQAQILELINEYPIETQEELMTRLNDIGFKVTQATVSRDIKELRLLKTLSSDGKYRYTSINKGINDNKDNVRGFFNNSVISVRSAQNMVVIKTLAGMANALCASLDGMEIRSVIGTLAGDDTIFIVCSDTDSASKLVIDLKKYL